MRRLARRKSSILDSQPSASLNSMSFAELHLICRQRLFQKKSTVAQPLMFGLVVSCFLLYSLGQPLLRPKLRKNSSERFRKAFIPTIYKRMPKWSRPKPPSIRRSLTSTPLCNLVFTNNLVVYHSIQILKITTLEVLETLKVEPALLRYRNRSR